MASARNAAIPSKKPTAENDDGLGWKDSRGDKTAIELFRHGVRDGAGPLIQATEALATIPA